MYIHFLSFLAYLVELKERLLGEYCHFISWHRGYVQNCESPRVAAAGYRSWMYMTGALVPQHLNWETIERYARYWSIKCASILYNFTEKYNILKIMNILPHQAHALIKSRKEIHFHYSPDVGLPQNLFQHSDTWWAHLSPIQLCWCFSIIRLLSSGYDYLKSIFRWFSLLLHSSTSWRNSATNPIILIQWRLLLLACHH